MKFGIDVSAWQKGFDLNYAKAEGFVYVIAKAGGADSSKPYYKDSCFENFYKQGIADGFNVGAYYYGKAFSVDDAIKEASFFCQYLAGKQITHCYYDVEGAMLNQGYNHLTDIIFAFCQTMINNGYACGIYTSESHFNSLFNDSAVAVFPHWVARYSSKPPTLKSNAPIEIWQYGGSVNYIRSPKIHGTTVDQDQINIEWADAQYKMPMQPVIAPNQLEKSTDQLAVEVLAGIHGNGIARRIALGSRYAEVQKRVDEIIKERKEKGKIYVVQKGDTLTKIAKNYNTTVKALVDKNGIENPNLIEVGQHIILC